MRSLLCCMAMLSQMLAWSQARNAHWFVGDGAHIEFVTGAPALMHSPSGIMTQEGQGVISDPSGDFLCIANHLHLFGALGGSMPNGNVPFTTDVNGDATQGSLFVPDPGNSARYVVVYVHTKVDEYWPRAKWAVVDMSMDGGNGDVVLNSWQLFSDSLTEKLTGTPHANGTDYWVLMHEWDTDQFQAYLISAAGLDTVPVSSHAGSPHVRFYILPNFNNNHQGQMKFNVEGDRIALTTQNASTPQPAPTITQLFTFDDATGQVSYRMSFPEHYRSYGIEFSGDGSKLYVSGYDSIYHYVDQYDLSLDDTLSIQNSRTRIYAYDHSAQVDHAWDRPQAMALAPDGRIYVTRAYEMNPWFAIIDQPNEAGLACNFLWNGLDVSPAKLLGSHCNQMKRYHDSPYTAEIHELAQRPLFSLSPNPVSGPCWIDGKGLRGALEVRWRDATGREVLCAHAVGNGFGAALDATPLSNGIYTIQLLQRNAVIGTLRAVVQR